ncbi:aminotransferase class V-fold PLP-dependent enzyme [Pseudanabaena sp. FACHB-2040]|uniref:aminotransferase class V-fold PLP-dependent enzyme n=1 Tax=Pseudanabaena sp. FACHB-2040 TaxID=2692859 RepID=UPI00321FD64A
MNSPSSTQTDLAIFRQQFPALLNKTYFNYGGQGPMPRAALDAILQAHERTQQEGPFSVQVNQWVGAVGAAMRQTMAGELGAPVEAIALTEDVTVGCNIPLWGVDWQAGDHILMTDCEHPGVIAAVQEICRRFGVTASTCPILSTLNGGDPVAVIAQHLQPQTRMLVVSHILWNTGQVLPLKSIAQLCHAQARPVLVHVDAAQSVGSLPLNLTDLEIDFYAFTGHKWWCGPAGLGGLYVRPGVLEQIQPTYIGWRGITTDASANPTGWQPTAQRYEVATSDFALMAGLEAAIATHHTWGTAEQRYQRICQLSHYLWQRLNELPGIQCLRSAPPESGLISFYVLEQGVPSPQRHRQLVKDLEDRGFLLRVLLSPHCVRACVHYLTLESEIDALMAEIVSLL